MSIYLSSGLVDSSGLRAPRCHCRTLPSEFCRKVALEPGPEPPLSHGKTPRSGQFQRGQRFLMPLVFNFPVLDIGFPGPLTSSNPFSLARPTPAGSACIYKNLHGRYLKCACWSAEVCWHIPCVCWHSWQFEHLTRTFCWSVLICWTIFCTPGWRRSVCLTSWPGSRRSVAEHGRIDSGRIWS